MSISNAAKSQSVTARAARTLVFRMLPDLAHHFTQVSIGEVIRPAAPTAVQFFHGIAQTDGGQLLSGQFRQPHLDLLQRSVRRSDTLVPGRTDNSPDGTSTR
jgi:hypothetical protein